MIYISELTNLLDSPSEGKRQRLLRSAKDLFYWQGVERPTLAEVAADAEVPVGNVYYYFKTRDELVEAVIDARAGELRQFLASVSTHSSPRSRLKALAHVWVANQADIAAHGCPFGSLCSELNKQGRGLDERAGTIFAEAADWITDQFRQLGQRDARALAMTVLATVQGAALLANTFRDPGILASQIRRLERWIDTLGNPEK